MQQVVLFDDGGKTLDRYTIIFLDSSYAGSSKTCEAIAGEYYCQPRPRITEAFLREELGFGDKEIMLAQHYSGLIEF